MGKRVEIAFDVNVYVDVILGTPMIFPSISEVPPRSGNNSADALSVIFDSERYQLFLSPHIIRNVQRVLLATGVPAELVETYLQFLVELVLECEGEVIEPTRAVFELKDHEDNYILDLVKAVDAKILVTSDQELLGLSPWNGRIFIDPSAFVRRHLDSISDW